MYLLRAPRRRTVYQYSIKLFSDKVPSKINTTFRQSIQRIKRIFLQRIVFFRVLFLGSIVLILYTTLRYTNNSVYAKNTTPVFFLKNKADPNAFYSVAGVVKPGSVNYVAGTDEFNFILTDFEHELKVFYKGRTPNNFIEGNTAICNGSITDADKPNIFISHEIFTNHAYNLEKWQSRKGSKAAVKEEKELEDILKRCMEDKSNFTKMA